MWNHYFSFWNSFLSRKRQTRQTENISSRQKREGTARQEKYTAAEHKQPCEESGKLTERAVEIRLFPRVFCACIWKDLTLDCADVILNRKLVGNLKLRCPSIIITKSLTCQSESEFVCLCSELKCRLTVVKTARGVNEKERRGKCVVLRYLFYEWMDFYDWENKNRLVFLLVIWFYGLRRSFTCSRDLSLGFSWKRRQRICHRLITWK